MGLVGHVRHDERAEPPVASTRRTVSFNVSAVRPATVTSAPSAARARALARPMPLPPPVTSADFPAIAVSLLLSSHVCPLWAAVRQPSTEAVGRTMISLMSTSAGWSMV